VTSIPFEGHDDVVLPFAVEGLDVRGRVVRLGPMLDTLLTRHNYPVPVARLVGEAVALTVLLGAALKIEGRFQLMTQTNGAVDLIVVDFDAPDQVRAYARFNAEELENKTPSSAALLGHGYLAFTIDPGNEMSRYQGIVPLEGQGLEEAAHHYFRQSEQIPTLIRLAVAEELSAGEGGGTHTFRAGGLMVQFLPAASERAPPIDLPPGDHPDPQAQQDDLPEDEAWTEARALIETVQDHELIDTIISSERLLYRLFHERGVRVYHGQKIIEACRCSEQRIFAMMKRFSTKDRADMVGDDGRIRMTCEFCSRVYDLDPATVEAEISHT
jgi:molecular chaperone Hsp33